MMSSRFGVLLRWATRAGAGGLVVSLLAVNVQAQSSITIPASTAAGVALASAANYKIAHDPVWSDYENLITIAVLNEVSKAAANSGQSTSVNYNSIRSQVGALLDLNPPKNPTFPDEAACMRYSVDQLVSPKSGISLLSNPTSSLLPTVLAALENFKFTQLETHLTRDTSRNYPAELALAGAAGAAYQLIEDLVEEAANLAFNDDSGYAAIINPVLKDLIGLYNNNNDAALSGVVGSSPNGVTEPSTFWWVLCGGCWALALFSDNLAFSGDAGSHPNEFLQLPFAGGISRVTITLLVSVWTIFGTLAGVAHRILGLVSHAKRIPFSTALRNRLTTLFLIVFVAVSSVIAAPPLYTIGNIPPLEVQQNTKLSFQIQSARLGVATFAYTLDPGYPAPQGAITFVPSSGLFTYLPTAADKFQFRVTFSSTVSGTPDSQSVMITPIASLSPESDVITHTALPDAASTDYLVVTQSQNSARERFNGTTQSTFDVEITGKTVVFDSSSSLYGGLYTRFHNRPNLKNVTIYAETLIIRSPLKLPGANVTIYARQLRFEDTAGQASMDTTSVAYSTAATQFQDGLPGQRGGDITLRIENFFSQPGPSVRFVSRGGGGQGAGQGAPGNTGSPTFTSPTACCPITGYIPLTPMTNKSYSNLWVLFDEFPWLVEDGGPVVRAPSAATCLEAAQASVKSSQNWQAPYPNAVFIQVPNGALGSQVWPGNGSDAQPGGRPGDAGSGGNVSSSLSSLAQFAIQSGGLGGGKVAAQTGGAAGQPNPAVWITWENRIQVGTDSRGQPKFQRFYCATDQHSSQSGGDSVPLSANVPVGAPGTFTTLTGQAGQWLHPYFLRQVIAHAKDAYRGGNLDLAKDIFTTYIDAIKQYGTPPPEFALAFEQAQQEMEGLLLQITNNVDYFGNGPGWVPLLSLEANMSAFNSEVDAALRLIYLSLYLQAKSDQNTKDSAALNDSIKKLGDDSTQTAADVNTSLQNVPALQFQAGQITTQVDQMQTKLQGREADLIQKAKDNVEESKSIPFWQTGLRVLGTIAELGSKVVPELLPVAVGLNTGVDLLTSTNNTTPWAQIKGYGNIAAGVLSFNFQHTSNGLQQALKTLDFSNPSKAKDSAKMIADAAAASATIIEDQIRKNESQQISNDEVEQEYAKLRAHDGALNDLIQQLASLRAQKEVFDTALQQAIQTISSGTTKITQDLVTIASLYQDLDAKVTQVDHATVVYVRDMDRRARERLIRYQYFMAKAYEYRMLQPYPNDLNLQCGDQARCVVDKILAIMKTDGYAATPTNMAAITDVYKESVRQIIYSALTQYQTQPHDTSLPFILELTAPELQQLNQTGQVTIDISSRIAGQPNEQNRHISNVAVDFMGVQPTGTIPGGAARVRAIIAHQGSSTETLNGHTYRFYFGTSPKDQPFTWGASYDLLSNQLAQEVPGPDIVSFIKTTLNLPATTGDVSVLFARPGADAMLAITKASTPSSLPAVVTKLRLAVTVDFFRINSNLVTLTVQTPNGNLPFVSVNQTDVTGRSDGRGTFRRTFNAGEQVTLSAEPIYQGLKFSEWVDENGTILGKSSVLTLNVTAAQTVHPVYVPLSIATMASPSPSSVLSGSTVTFTWDGVSGATAYWLDVGTISGQGNIFGQNVGSATSHTVNAIPTNGSPIYVRLWTQSDNGWQPNDYIYTAASAQLKAVMLAPSSNSVLSGSTVTFTWSAGFSAAAYWLDVGTIPGKGNIFGANVGLATSQTVTGVPINGSSIYVRLWTQFGAIWQPTDYVYTAAGSGAKAAMLTPPPSSVLNGSTVTFTWSVGSGAAAYWLDVGTIPGKGDIFGKNVGLATSQTVMGILTSGNTIYVRLWTLSGSTWQSNDYLYTASGGGTRAAILTPAAGAVLSGTTVTFTWSPGSGATAYWLDVGTIQGQGDIFGRNVGLETSQTVSGIPTNGTTIYLRLWTQFGSSWQPTDYVYITAGKAVMLSPPPSSVLADSVVRFSWSAGSGATAYWLDVGTIPGQGNIFGKNTGLVTNQSVTGIPVNGSPVYVRLWTQFGSVWQPTDYAYTAASPR